MLLLLLLVVAHVIAVGECGGQFYVGLLGYSNKGNLKYTGDCCDGERNNDGVCTDHCDLIFEVEIHGLNSSVTGHRPSHHPINTTIVTQFPSSHNGFRNPLAFQFTRWPADVNITVSVYDKDDGVDPLVLVDRFWTTFTYSQPTVFYILRQLHGRWPIPPSTLDILFRYKCNSDVTESCFDDCMNHTEAEICPVTSPHPAPTDVTYTGFIDPLCDSSDDSNCSITHVTVGSSTTQPSFANGSASATPRSAPIRPRESSKRTFPVTSTQTPTVSPVAIATTAANTTNTTKTVSSTAPETAEVEIRPIVIPTIVIQTAPRAQGAWTTPPSTGKVASTTPHRLEMADDDMDYWPAIVGGVLGGLALLVAVAVVFYYKRQKKMEKRQEIYNVNPKIVRNFYECEENGTSGRADVALETEQV